MFPIDDAVQLLVAFLTNATYRDPWGALAATKGSDGLVHLLHLGTTPSVVARMTKEEWFNTTFLMIKTVAEELTAVGAGYLVRPLADAMGRAKQN